MTEERNELELVLLEEQLDDEIHCEMRHNTTPCSKTVTHLAIDCRRDFFVCAVAHETIKLMREQGSECAHCHRAAEICWRVVPLVG